MEAGSRGLALDLDGTLLNSMSFHVQAWGHAFAQFDLTPSLEWFYLWEGASGKEVIDRALALLDIDLSAEDRAEILRIKRLAFDETFQALAFPGLEALRRLLVDYRYPVAVVTGSEQRVAERALTAIGFREVVSVIVGSDGIAHGKPAPDPYLMAAQKLALPVERCLVLENAPLGIDSARAAGMPCAAVETTLSAEHLYQADWIVDDLQAFSDLLCGEHHRSGGNGDWRFTGAC